MLFKATNLFYCKSYFADFSVKICEFSKLKPLLVLWGPGGHVSCHEQIVPDRFSSFNIYWIYKQANKKSIQFSSYLILSIKQFRWFSKVSIRLPFKKKSKFHALSKMGLPKKILYCMQDHAIHPFFTHPVYINNLLALTKEFNL